MTTNELSTNANLDLLAQRINAEHGAARGAFTKCPSGDFMSRMNRLSGGPS